MSTRVRTHEGPSPWEHDDAEVLLRLIQSTGEYAVITLDPTGHVRTWNPAAERLLGYMASEAVGQFIGMIFTEEDRTARRPENEMAEAAETGHANHSRWHRRRDGSRIWVGGIATALRDDAGALLGYGKILRDAGELRATQEEARRLADMLEAERVRIAAVLEQLPSGLAVAEAPSGRLLYHNHEAERLLGHPMPLVADYSGYERYGAIHDDGTAYRPHEYPIARALFLGEVVDQEPMRYRRGDGSETVFVVSAAPVRDPDGTITAAISAFYDVSSQRAFDDRLRHTQKLESIGVLAGGIAHDFNNLLTSILGNVHLALRGLPPESARQAEPMLRDAIHAGERGADLTRQLLAYAGKGSFQLAPVDLCELIHEMTQLFRTTMSRLLELRLDITAECSPIQGDRAQLKQLLLALVTNAAEAIESRTGVITVRVRIEELAERAPLAEFAEAPPNGGRRYVRLDVEDTGSGMNADTRARIFDPFFTTKFLGRGLGLSAALGIVRAHRGGIHVQSGPGRGTKFTVLLPAVPARPPEAKRKAGRPTAEGSAEPGSKGAVLLVDDEEPVRAFMKRVLERLGLEVLPAGDGAEALRVLEASSGRGPDRTPRLVILDLALPGVEGAEVASIIRDRWPTIPVIVCSGLDDATILERVSSASIAGVLQKPFAPELLAAEVERVLGARRG